MKRGPLARVHGGLQRPPQKLALEVWRGQPRTGVCSGTAIQAGHGHGATVPIPIGHLQRGGTVLHQDGQPIGLAHFATVGGRTAQGQVVLRPPVPGKASSGRKVLPSTGSVPGQWRDSIQRSKEAMRDEKKPSTQLERRLPAWGTSEPQRLATSVDRLQVVDKSAVSPTAHSAIARRLSGDEDREPVACVHSQPTGAPQVPPVVVPFRQLAQVREPDSASRTLELLVQPGQRLGLGAGNRIGGCVPCMKRSIWRLKRCTFEAEWPTAWADQQSAGALPQSHLPGTNSTVG